MLNKNAGDNPHGKVLLFFILSFNGTYSMVHAIFLLILVKKRRSYTELRHPFWISILHLLRFLRLVISLTFDKFHRFENKNCGMTNQLFLSRLYNI